MERCSLDSFFNLFEEFELLQVRFRLDFLPLKLEALLNLVLSFKDRL